MTAADARPRIVTVFGGSGFVGRHLVRALVKRGWNVRVAVRRPDLAFHLQPLGRVGQIKAVQTNLRFPASIEPALDGVDAAINLVGIMTEGGAQSFEAVHVNGAAAVAAACRAAGVTNLVQMSALGANAESKSDYARTKAEGEAAVRSALPGSIVIRPSVQFGPEDNFFNRFAAMAQLSPIALPLVGPDCRMQPVFVGDVAEAIAHAVDGLGRPGTTYELGGPEVRSFRELMQQMLAVIERRRLLLAIPFPVAAPLGSLLQMLPGKLLTADQVELLQADNVVSAEALAEGRTLEGLGITPTSLAAILPSYLERFRPYGQFGRRRAA